MRSLKISSLLIPTGTALAYGFTAQPAAASSTARVSQLPWNWDPWIVGSLALASFAYLAGLRRLDAVSRQRLFGWPRCTAFLAGIASLFAVLVSPFDALDDQLFSAHMCQHLVLFAVAPPLLVFGRPIVAWLWAFPPPWRRAIGKVWVRSRLAALEHAVMTPIVVWILSSVALWFWHLPGPYGWALSNEFVHAFEHVCFFATSLMFWTLVLEPFERCRLGFGGRMLFTASFGLECGFLGALLTFAGRPLYVNYIHTTFAWGLTPLEDQQLSGLVMWIPTSFIHLAALAFLFMAWMHAADREVRADAGGRRSKGPPYVAFSSVVMTAILLSALSGCGGNPSQPKWSIADGNAIRGRSLFQTYGCGSCHTIPGVPNATGQVGPPLEQFGRRAYVAGMLQNNPDNLLKWLTNPQRVVPGNAMPNMQVTDSDARDLAAFLYALPEH